MADPFFSIVMPTFNRASMLRRSVQSVLDQTFSNWELIVVDDGSSDETAELIRGFQDDRIRYFFKTNEERSIARNFGIDQARGRYINFLDSDDYHLPHHLETAYKLLLNTPECKFLHLSYEIVDAVSGAVRMAKLPSTDDVLEFLCRENTLNCNTVFVQTDILREIRFPNSPRASIGEDWYLWLRLAARHTIHFDPTVTSVVLHHPGRSIMQIDPNCYQQAVCETLNLLEHDDVLIKRLGRNAFDRMIAYQFLGIALQHAIATPARKIKSLQFAWKALSASPSVALTRRFLVIVKKVLSPG